MYGNRGRYYDQSQSWYTDRDQQILQENFDGGRQEIDRFLGNGRHRQNNRDLQGYLNCGYENDFYDDRYESNTKTFDGNLHYATDNVHDRETDYTDIHHNPVSRQSNEFDMEERRAASTGILVSNHRSSKPSGTEDLRRKVGQYDYEDNRPLQLESHEIGAEKETEYSYGQSNGRNRHRGGRHDRDQFEMRHMVDEPVIRIQDHRNHITPDYYEELADYTDSEDENTEKASGFDMPIVYLDGNSKQHFDTDFDACKLSGHDTNVAHSYSRDTQSNLSNTDSLYLGQGHNVYKKGSRRFRKSYKLRQDQRISFADGMKTLIRRRQTLRLKSQYKPRNDVSENTRDALDVDHSHDKIYEGINNVMTDEQLPSTNLTKTKTLKQRLELLQKSGAEVSTAQIATLLRDNLLVKEALKLKGMELHKYQMAMRWQRFKNWIKSKVYQLELWSGAFKIIEGQFGTATMSYFRFLRWMMFLNMFMTIFMMSIVFLPFVVIQPSTDFVSSVRECDSEYHYRAFFLSSNYSDYTRGESSTESASQLVLDVLQGTGWLENTELFYGKYHNKTSTLLSGSEFIYNMGLAYLFAVGLCFLLSFILLVKNSAKGFKQSVLMSSSGNVTLYCNKVFGAWDFCISQQKTAVLKHKNILQDLMNELQYQRLQWKKESRTRKEKIILYSIRFLINCLVVTILGGSLYLIYFTNTRLIEYTTQERNHVLQLILEYLPSIVITVLSVIVPMIFNKVVVAEDYMPTFRIRITLTRTVLLRLSSLGMLMISLYTGLTKGRMHTDISIPCLNVTDHGMNSSQDNLPDSTNNNSYSSPLQDIQCWETYVGQQIYKLVFLNFLFALAAIFFWEFPRTFFFKKFNEKVKVIKLLGQQQFDLTKNVLDLIYLQSLCWLGVFFSPLIPAMCFVKCFIFFYVKKLSLLHNCLPMQEYGTSGSNSLFMTVLLLSFALAAIPIGAMIGIIQPSEACGPFRVYSSEGYVMFDAITNLVNSWTKVKMLFHFVGTGGFMCVLGFLLCCLMYYYYIVGQAHYKMSKTLREQLKTAGKDKQFLLTRVNEAMALDAVVEERADNADAGATTAIAGALATC